MLTRTQLDALAHLHKTGAQYPAGRGRIGRLRDGYWTRHSRRTLDALAAAGVARWERARFDAPPVLRQAVAVVDGDGGPHVVLPGDWTEPDRRAVACAVLTGELWRRYPQAYIDDDRVTRLAHRIIDGEHHYREEVAG